MLIETDAAAIAAFKARKEVQGAAAMAVLPGVSMAASGERGTSISLCHDGRETVIIGQLPHAATIVSGSAKNPVRRDMPNAKKPLEKRGIDLTDEQVGTIIATWGRGGSALEHAFVAAVFKDGAWHKR